MKKKGIDRDVRLLGESSFLNDIGSEMVSPILPFYILALGGGGIAIGLLSGLKEGFSSLCKLFGGWFSDRWGKRKPVIFAGYVISILFKFLLGIAGSWQQLIAFVSLERFGKVRSAPRDAMIGNVKKQKGRNFGIHRMMDSFGAFVGSLFVLFLFWKFSWDFKLIIFIAAGISLFALLPLRRVKEHKIKATKWNLNKSIKSLDGKLKYFVFVAGVFTLANFGLYMFLLLRIKELTGSLIIALMFYVLFNFALAVFAIPSGKMSDKFGRKRMLFVGYSLFVVLGLGFIFFENILAWGKGEDNASYDSSQTTSPPSPPVFNQNQ